MHIFKKIMEGIAYLIDKNILHRDLKPSNIIIDKNLIPVIIDFGFCEIIHEAKISRVFNVGSPSYMAPEAYLRTLYS
jgi:serine/threonine protein kinase